jgi:hypothetical protein
MFSFWINTAFIEGDMVRLTKSELDGANSGKNKARVDESFVLEVKLEGLEGGFSSAREPDQSDEDSVEFEEYDADEIDDIDSVFSQSNPQTNSILAPLHETRDKQSNSF